MNADIDATRAATLLSKAIVAVCADTAFIDVMPARAPIGPGIGFDGASIDVLRPVSCALELYFAPEFGAKVAGTLFSPGATLDENGPSEANARDSILEMLNIAAGTFLSDYCGPGADIKLELPRFLPGGPERSGGEVCSVDFDAEGLPLRAVLRSIRYRY
jgi:hypothetical protein